MTIEIINDQDGPIELWRDDTGKVIGCTSQYEGEVCEMSCNSCYGDGVCHLQDL